VSPAPSTARNVVFFCTGRPKSGTTYLQRLLDRHPDISCLAEQDLDQLAALLGEALKSYNRAAADLDRRTGGSGRPAFETAQLRPLVRAATLLMLRQQAGGKRFIGAKDNRLLPRLDFYGAVFPGARFLCILRNPVDRAVSAWHHNRRLAEQEKNPRHLELMEQHGDLGGWVRHVCRLMETEVEAYRRTRLTAERRLLLRYEDLMGEPQRELDRALHFLGAERSEATIAAMLARSTLAVLRAEATDPAFFRRGAVDGGKAELDQALRMEIDREFRPLFATLGYRITAEGLELLPPQLA
jgi:hypothetical protein